MNDIHEFPSIIGSCNCMTKTNLPEYHRPKCPFRLLTQMHLLLEKARKIHQWAEKNSNVEFLANDMLKFKENPKLH
jgi:hypothetical protein